MLEFNKQWADAENPGTIVYMELKDGGSLIIDTRFNVENNVLRLSAPENRVLRYLDKIRTTSSIIRFGDEIKWNREQGIMDFVLAMQNQRFVISEGERFVGVIPIPDEEPADIIDGTYEQVAVAESDLLSATS